MSNYEHRNDGGNSLPEISPIFKWTWLALLLALGLFLRIRGANAYNFNFDEFRHIHIASATSIANVLRYSLYEAHPPLFYILLHYWMMISSDRAFMSGLPLLMSMTLIPLYYLIGRQMNGERCGLWGATLMTLSYGCVVQSCLMRHYVLLLLFISLHFYCYLHWRETRRRSLLPWLVLWGWLASLSHFSAIFYFLCIATFEAAEMIRRGAARSLLWEWISVNLLIAGVAVFVYYLWRPYLLSGINPYIVDAYRHTPSNFLQLLEEALNSLFGAASYIYRPFLLLPFLIMYFITADRDALRPYLNLAGFACFTCIALYLLNVYPRIGNARHGLWILPFLLPVAGGTFANWWEKVVKQRTLYISIIAAVIGLSAADSYVNRFFNEEYDLRKDSWRALTDKLNTFGPRDLIVENNDLNMNMLTSIYPYFSDHAFLNRKGMTLVPYANTHIFMSYYYFIGRGLPAELLEASLKEAEAQHMLDGIDRLVFLHEPIRLPAISLLLCANIPKEIINFPASAPDATLEQKIFPPYGLAITVVSKKAFLDYVPEPGAKARACANQT